MPHHGDGDVSRRSGMLDQCQLYLRLFMTPLFRLRRSTTWVGKSLCFRSARARSSVSAGSDAAATSTSVDTLRTDSRRGVASGARAVPAPLDSQKT